MNTNDYNILIDTIKQIAGSECQRIMKSSNVASNYFATVVGVNENKTYNVMLASGTTPYTNVVNKTGETIDTGDVVLVEALNGNIGNGYIKLKQGISDISGAPDTIAWSKVYNTPHTLGGYGITDAKIDNGVITLGTNSITPITEDNIPVKSVNNKTGAVVLTASDVGALPTSTVIPTKVSQLDNDSGYITKAPVTSVNGETGVVVLTASDVSAVPASRKINGKTLTSDITLTAANVGALPDTTVVPTKTSELDNDSNFISDENYVHTDNNFTAALKDQIGTNTTNITNHIANTSNPHNVTKTQVGLSNVDNVKQWSNSNHPTTLNDYGITDGVTITEFAALSEQVDTNTTDIANHIADTSNPHEVTKTQVGLSNVDNVKQYSASNPPPYPVTKVNGYTGEVSLSASDVDALPISGGTLTGDLTVGEASVGTDGKIVGTWLQGTADNHLTTQATKIAVQDTTGTIYNRTSTEILSDIGAMPNQAATTTTLGGIKVGIGLAITDEGVLNATGGGVADAVEWDNVLNTPTTIAGYGITDAVTSVNGETGDITIEANTITYKIDSPTVSASSWTTNTNSQAEAQERTDYPYMATITITNPAITTNDIARVMFNYTEQASDNFSMNCYTITNGVIIEAKEKPTASITLNYIYIERTTS